MRTKSVVGFAAIVAALWVVSAVNQDRFREDIYMVCIGHASDGPFVTEAEIATCACMADAAVAAVPWKSRLPQSMISLGSEDNARMFESQKTCAPEPAES